MPSQCKLSIGDQFLKGLKLAMVIWALSCTFEKHLLLVKYGVENELSCATQVVFMKPTWCVASDYISVIIWDGI